MSRALLSFAVFISLCLHCAKSVAQIGMNSNNPDKSAILDMRDAQNKGLLIPQITLTSTTDKSQINGGEPAQSLLVYNTNASITGSGADGTGFYYWDVDTWRKLITDTFWNINGNTGTVPPGNFIGTIDNKDLVFKTNNVERMRILAGGNIGIGTSTPSNILTVNSGIANSSGLTFQQLNSSSPVTYDAMPLGVDATGTVVVKNGASRRPYFNAYKLNSPTSVDETDITTLTKTADTYNVLNENTGVFTAPEDGFYIFVYGADFGNNTGGVICLSLHLNGTTYGGRNQFNALDSGIPYTTNCNYSTFLKLTKNDTVSFSIFTQRSLIATKIYFSGIQL